MYENEQEKLSGARHLNYCYHNLPVRRIYHPSKRVTVLKLILSLSAFAMVGYIITMGVIY